MLLSVTLIWFLSLGSAVGVNPSYTFSAGRSSGNFCGASLFHDDLLLTAASCYGVFAEGVLMGGGALDGSDGYFFAVDAEIPHPDYTPGKVENNLMVVKLKSASNFTVQSLNADAKLPLDGANLVVSGFSRRVTETSLPANSNDVAAKKVDHATCTNKYSSAPGVYIVDNKLFCSSTVDIHQCHGNMGGPVLDGHGSQVGVVAGGTDCDTDAHPTMNVRVSSFKAFLRAAVCELSSYPPDACPKIETSNTISPTLAPGVDVSNAPTIPANRSQVNSSSLPVEPVAPSPAPTEQPTRDSPQPSQLEYSSSVPTGVPSMGIESLEPSVSQTPTVKKVAIANVTTPGSNKAYAFSAGRSSGQFCGATLVHDDLLLTAAACYGVFAEGVLMGGSWLDGSDGYFYAVDREVPHPDYTPGDPENNLMIIKLKSSPANFSIQLLNRDDEMPFDTTPLFVSGFSRLDTEKGLPKLSNDVVARKVDESACATLYSSKPGMKVVSDKMFCSSTLDPRRCHGNMGDPLLNEYGAQVGIVAGGSDCHTDVHPTLNVRVSVFKRFLRAAVCELSAVPPEACQSTPTSSPIAVNVTESSLTDNSTSVPNVSDSILETPSPNSTPTLAPVAASSIQPSAIESSTISPSNQLGSSTTNSPTLGLSSLVPSASVSDVEVDYTDEDMEMVYNATVENSTVYPFSEADEVMSTDAVDDGTEFNIETGDSNTTGDNETIISTNVTSVNATTDGGEASSETTNDGSDVASSSLTPSVSPDDRTATSAPSSEDSSVAAAPSASSDDSTATSPPSSEGSSAATPISSTSMTPSPSSFTSVPSLRGSSGTADSSPTVVGSSTPMALRQSASPATVPSVAPTGVSTDATKTEPSSLLMKAAAALLPGDLLESISPKHHVATADGTAPIGSSVPTVAPTSGSDVSESSAAPSNTDTLAPTKGSSADTKTEHSSMLMKAVSAIIPGDLLDTISPKHHAAIADSTGTTVASAPTVAPTASSTSSPVMIPSAGPSSSKDDTTPTDVDDAALAVVSSDYSPLGNDEFVSHLMGSVGLGWWNKTKAWGTGLADKFNEKCPTENDCELLGVSGSTYHATAMGQCAEICDITKSAHMMSWHCGVCSNTTSMDVDPMSDVDTVDDVESGSSVTDLGKIDSAGVGAVIDDLD